jgi:hypothetical protein
VVASGEEVHQRIDFVVTSEEKVVADYQVIEGTGSA